MAVKQGKKPAKRPRSKAAAPSEVPVEKNGWTLYAHPAFLDHIDQLEAQLAKNPGPRGGPAKVLTWITRAIFDEIPEDPSRPEYRLGGALGGVTHWFRDKYAGRFRLFFRFDTRAKIIIYGWVNDDQSLRNYGASSDAYAVFRRRLAGGDPPDGWSALLKEASAPTSTKRLKGTGRKS